MPTKKRESKGSPEMNRALKSLMGMGKPPKRPEPPAKKPRSKKS